MGRMPLAPFQTVIDTYSDSLGRFLVASVGPDDADDALQETLLAALRAYPRLRPGSNVRAWLFTIARNKALDQHRSRSRRPVPVGHAEPGAAYEPGGGDDELWNAVGRLPAKQRAAVVLRYVNDLSHREIAAVLGCSEAAARRSLHEGLTKLRKDRA
jgi:RNA polymerase sigma factor (sigma-70 family)